MDEFNKHVNYMENHDFDKKGNLINKSIPNNIFVVIMIQASWCHFCKQAKPHFQKFAKKHKNKVFCATIESNGERESEKKLGNRVNDFVPDFKGFPHYILYKDGKMVNKKIKGRSVEHLENFVGINM